MHVFEYTYITSHATLYVEILLHFIFKTRMLYIVYCVLFHLLLNWQSHISQCLATISVFGYFVRYTALIIISY
jgi:hypothetical protein